MNQNVSFHISVTGLSISPMKVFFYYHNVTDAFSVVDRVLQNVSRFLVIKYATKPEEMYVIVNVKSLEKTIFGSKHKYFHESNKQSSNLFCEKQN